MIVDKGIPIKNIYYMLSYAFTSLHRDYDEEIAGEEFDNIHNLFAAILAKGIGHQIKQGLYCEYIETAEETTTIHGKISMIDTMRNQYKHTGRAFCEYDDFSRDNIYNQVIKVVARILIRDNEVEAVYKDELRKEMQYFSDVTDIEPLKINWSALCFHRNNQTYRMLLGLAQMILQGMLLTTDDGTYRLARFVDEQRMCRLYEKFILEYYRKEMPLLRAEASQIAWALDDGSQALLPTMQSDVMLSDSKKVLIIDAKYYAHTSQIYYDSQSVHSNNIYQIFAYVKNKKRDPGIAGCEVAGMLLYARTQETLQPDISPTIDGNKIYVRTLNLNADFSSISQQLNKIAIDFFGESCRN